MKTPEVRLIHTKTARAVINRRELEALILAHVAASVGFQPHATTAKFSFQDVTEGSPGYKVGTECIVDLIEDQTMLPQAGEPK